MGHLLITLLFIAHLSLTKAIGLLFQKMGISSTFKRLMITAPMNIILSIVFIYMSELSWSNAGFIIGDLYSGLFYILILGVPITLLFTITFLKMDEDEVENIISIGGDNLKSSHFMYGFWLGLWKNSYTGVSFKLI